MKPAFQRLFAVSASLTIVGSTTLALLPGLQSPAKAAFPGYNGKIVFESWRDGDSEIFTINANGTNESQLTNNSASDRRPAWSPDRSKILFTSDQDGTSDLYVMGADGTNLIRLTSNATYEVEPKWSPDGTQILFTGAGAGIYIMDADGTNSHQVPLVTASAGADWSPDGTKITFWKNSGNTSIFVVNVDGTNQIRLTDNALGDYYPVFSPNGEEIAFYRGDYATLGIVKTDGSGEIEYDLSDVGNDKLTYMDDVAWSPDGSSLLLSFSDPDWDVTNLYVFKVTDTSLNQITQINGYAGDWSSIPNVAPVTAADTLSVAYETAGTASVLVNDTDEEALEGSNLSITAQPTHGSASVKTAQGKIEYTPANGYSGSDTLTYQVCDSFTLDQKCSSAVLGITVAAGPIPAAPTITSVGTVQMHGATTVYYTGHRPTFAGTATPGSVVTVEIHSDPIILTTTPDGAGNWTVTPNQDIPNGEHEVLISVTKDGSSSAPLKLVLGINTGLAATGVPVWPLSLIGLVSLFGLRRYLQRQVTAHR